MPGQGRRARSPLRIQERAGLGHAGHADASDDGPGGDSGIVQAAVGQRDRKMGEGVGVDVCARAVVAPGSVLLGLADDASVDGDRECLDAGGPDVDADEQFEPLGHDQRAASGASGAGGRHATATRAPSAVQSPAA